MQSIDIRVQFKKAKWHLELGSKFTQIIGNSATGKSTLSDACSLEKIKKYTYVKISDMRYTVESALDHRADFITWVSSSANKILLIDESFYDRLTTSEVVDAIKKNTSCYFVFTCRRKLSSINIDISNVKEGIYKDGVITYRRVINEPVRKSNASEISCCIIEDSGLAYKWFKKLFNGVVELKSSYGKDSLCSIAEETLRNSRGTKVLLIFDRISFGSCLNEYRRLLDDYSDRIFVIGAYKSWEHMMLKSNLFSKWYKEYDISSCLFEEEYYEKLLEDLSSELTTKTVKHSKTVTLPKCYTDICCGYDNKNWRCLAKISNSSGDKFVDMLENTDYRGLLLLAGRVKA